MPYEFVDEPGGRFEFLDDEQPKGPPRRYVNPTRGKSNTKLAGQAAYKFLQDMALRGSQLATSIPAALGSEEAQAEQGRLEGIADMRKLDPVMRTGAGQAGYMAAAIAPAAASMFIPGANTMVGSTLIGGGMGLMQPVGTSDSGIVNTVKGAIGGAVGQGAANVLGRVARPIQAAIHPADRRAAAVLSRAGVPLTAAQKTGAPRAQQVERFLTDNPVTQPSMTKVFQKRQEAFTRAAVRTFGENADNAGPAVLERAATRIGSGMDDFAKRYDLDLTDPNVRKEIAHVYAEVSRLRSPAGDNRISVQIKHLQQLAVNGKLEGKAYPAVRRELAKLSRDPDVGEYAYRLQETLDDALQRAAGKEAGEIKKLRSQWRNLKAVEAVADTTERAQVSGPALAQHLKNSKFTRNSFRYGRGDTELSKLARAMSTVVDRFPQSGTAPRAGAQMVLPALAGVSGVGGAVFGEGSMEDRAINAAKWAAAGYAIPKAGVALMTNPRAANYLAGTGAGAFRNALMYPSKAGFGSLVPAYLLSQE